MEKKKAWKCSQCLKKLRVKNKNNMGNPIVLEDKSPNLNTKTTGYSKTLKHTSKSKDILTSDLTSTPKNIHSTAGASETPTSPNNNGNRQEELFIINVPTENSFGSLSDNEENLAESSKTSARLEDMEEKSISHTNYVNCKTRHINSVSPDSYSNLDSEQDEFLSHSLPNQAIDDEVSRLKQKIARLESEMEGAHEEISNLIQENGLLKKNLEKASLSIKSLKRLNSSTTMGSRSTRCSATKTRRNIHTHPSDTLLHPDISYCVKALDLNLNKKVSAENDSDITTQDTVKLTSYIPASQESTHSTKYIRTSTQVKRIGILSSNKRNNILNIAEDTFQGSFNFCHHLTPNVGVKELLRHISSRSLNKDDYYVVLIGESDFQTSKDYSQLVTDIRIALQQIGHTNIILCLPTFKCGEYSAFYNSRIEIFNSLLYHDIQTYEYAYLLDSNLHLSYDYDMFTRRQGLLKNSGMRNIFSNIRELILDIIPEASHSYTPNDSFRE